jgi:hypothetical protein
MPAIAGDTRSASTIYTLTLESGLASDDVVDRMSSVVQWMASRSRAIVTSSDLQRGNFLIDSQCCFNPAVLRITSSPDHRRKGSSHDAGQGNFCDAIGSIELVLASSHSFSWSLSDWGSHAKPWKPQPLIAKAKSGSMTNLAHLVVTRFLLFVQLRACRVPELSLHPNPLFGPTCYIWRAICPIRSP